MREAVLFFLCVCFPFPSFAVVFYDLGTLPGGSYSSSGGISNDGAFVVGQGNISTSLVDGGGSAYLWTSSGGMEHLGTIQGLPGGHWSRGLGISGDGSVVVGVGTFDTTTRPFLWTRQGGMQNLGTLGTGGNQEAVDASFDGSVIVGTSGNFAFRWNSNGGIQSIGALSGGFFSRAKAVNSDGTVIVGGSHSSSGLRAFLWNQAGGLLSLGTLNGGSSWSEAYGVSDDGNVVVGGSDTGNGSRAFRWTQDNGIQDLGSLGGNSTALGVSGDGSVVVGLDDTNQRAFLWTEAAGIQDLNTFLPGFGVDLTGLTLTKATAASFDGSIIIGEMVSDGGGGSRTFLVSGIPEPSSLHLITLSLFLFSKRFKRFFR